MRVKRSWFRAPLIWATCLSIGWASGQLDEDVAFAIAWPESRLEFEFVSDQVESELTCDLFVNCLHIEVINSAQCVDNVSVDLGFEDKFGQLIGGGEMVVPSPSFKGGFIVEIGSNQIDSIDTYGIYSVSCSSLLPNVFGSA